MSIFANMFRTERILRDSIRQSEVDAQTLHLALYHFRGCPFCQRVRKVIDYFQLDIELRDTRQNSAAYHELLKGGGRSMVPCLRIQHDGEDTEWLYESADIIAYLKRRFEANEPS